MSPNTPHHVQKNILDSHIIIPSNRSFGVGNILRMIFNGNHFWYLGISLLVIFSLAFGQNIQQPLSLTSQANNGIAKIFIQPGVQFLPPNRLFQIWATVNRPINSAYIVIHFDPHILTMTKDISFHNVAFSAVSQASSPAEANTTGTIIFNVSQPIKKHAPIRGTVLLGTISFGSNTHIPNTTTTVIPDSTLSKFTYNEKYSITNVTQATQVMVNLQPSIPISHTNSPTTSIPNATMSSTLFITQTPTISNSLSPTLSPIDVPTPTILLVPSETPEPPTYPSPTPTLPPVPTDTSTPTLAPIVTQISTPLSTQTPSSTPNNTPTPPQIPSQISTPPIQPSLPTDIAFDLRIKLTGVTDGSAHGSLATVRFVKDALDLTTPHIPIAYIANGIYAIQFITSTNALAPGSGYSIIIKIEKHVSTKYCKPTGQTTICQPYESLTIPNPSVPLIPNIFDFTQFPLIPGDLYIQDGKADIADFNKIKTRMTVPCDQLTDNDKIIADLDYNGCVNSLDAYWMRNTLETRYDEH
jgi:hypothetical protein